MSNANKLLNYRVDQETPKGEIEQRVETSEEQQTCSHCMGTAWVLMGAERRMKRLRDKSTLEPPVWVNRGLDRPTRATAQNTSTGQSSPSHIRPASAPRASPYPLARGPIHASAQERADKERLDEVLGQ